jgi:hypothetical protein
MLSIKIICGIIALLAAWALIFRKQLVYEFNRWMREYAFSDQWVIFSGTRAAVLLFILGALALFSGIETINQHQVLKPSVIGRVLENAHEDFKQKNFNRVVVKTTLILQSYPENQGARELLIGAYFSSHQPEKAKEEIENLILYNPNYNFRQGFLAPYKIRVVKKPK